MSSQKRPHVPDGMSVSPKSCAAIARGNEHAPRTQHEKQKALTIDRKCETWSSGGGFFPDRIFGGQGSGGVAFLTGRRRSPCFSRLFWSVSGNVAAASAL